MRSVTGFAHFAQRTYCYLAGVPLAPARLQSVAYWGILSPTLVMFQEIKDSLRRLYLEDPRPWLAGFSGGKDSTMLASLVFDAVICDPAGQRRKPVAVLCTDTRVEIPAIAEMVEGTLDRMRKCSEQQGLNIDASLLKPTLEESFWVNIIGRGHPLPLAERKERNELF